MSMLSKRLKDRIVEEEAKSSVGRVDWDVARQVMNTASEWLLNMHWLVGR